MCPEKGGLSQYDYQHHYSLICVFEKLLETSSLVDCTLIAEGQQLKSHKEVLSAFSPFFEMIFKDVTEQKPVFILEGISFKQLRALIEFMYFGRVQVDANELENLLEVAEYLQFRGLGRCFQKENSKSGNENVCVPPRENCSSQQHSDEVYNICTGIYADVLNSHQTGQISSMKTVTPRMNEKDSSAQYEVNISTTVSFSVDSDVSLDAPNALLDSESVVNVKPNSPNETFLTEECVDLPEEQIDELCVARERSRSYSERSDEEVLDSPAEIFLNCETNDYEQFPSTDNVSSLSPEGVIPQIENMQLSSNLFVHSSTTDPSNVETNSSLSQMNPTVSSVEMQDLSFNSEIILKTEANGDDASYVGEEGLVPAREENCQVDMTPSQRPEEMEHDQNVNITKENGGDSGAQKTVSSSGEAAHQAKNDTQEANPSISGRNAKSGVVEANPDAATLGIPCLIVLYPRNTQVHPESHCCPHCKQQFQTAKKLERHIDTHRRNEGYMCEFCGIIMKEWPNFCYHIRKHTRTPTGARSFVCDICEKKFSCKTSLKFHIRVHTGEQPYVCEECGKRFATPQSFKSHMQNHTGEFPHTCTICGKGFKSRVLLKAHIRIHTGERPFTCKDCGKSFIERGHLNRHRRAHIGVRSFICNKCGRSFLQPGSLKYHSRICMKANTCETCGLSFENKIKLKIHVLKHKGQKDLYSCEKCDKTFVTSGLLNAHILKRHRERPFTCDECGRTFSGEIYLERHMKRHTEDQFTCEECGKNFISSQHLKEHCRTHFFKCDKCKKKFSEKKRFQDHMQLHELKVPNSSELGVISEDMETSSVNA